MIVVWPRMKFASGMALYPFIFLSDAGDMQNRILINHERIHLRQQLELLILPFYLIYIFNYIINLLWYRNHYQAYMNIVFEKEAYRNEHNLHYLRRRWPWSFITYFFRAGR
ncbi:hypothetical protein [Eisenibacter elegans]|uniref:hypothetical protein n=1 Tax=Eisenibacter elegans TaxID=997 RepID=UPI001FDF1AB2|nr:hypothetical protein [Eisenibacter elegans]